MNKSIRTTFIVFLSMILCANCTISSRENQYNDQAAQTEDPHIAVAEQDTIKGSIPSEAIGRIGTADLKINYYSPGVKGRIIWGGLVPYDRVWVTGAHMATSIEANRNFVIGNTEVPRGKYALFTIPGREEWTVIVNRNWKQHLADNYDQKEDVLRVKIKPSVLAHHQERLKYDIIELSSTEGTINISWENLMVSIPFKII
jgi:hypothetical protein